MLPDAAPAPVFVDDTGRRHRAVRIIGWAIGSLVVGYLALLGISLVGSPGLVPLSLPAIGRLLPGPGAGQLTAGSSGGHEPASQLLQASPRATTAATASTVAPTRPGATTTHAPTARPRPTATPSASATPARTPQGNPSPNGSARPTHGPSAHPSPKNTKRSVRSPSPTPTATAT